MDLLRFQITRSQTDVALTRSQTDVALSLTNQLLQTKSNGSNLVFSPLSIQVVLSVITAGSNGSTRDQLLCFLKSKSSDHLNSFFSKIINDVFSNPSPVGAPRLSFANGIWVDKSLPLKHSFQWIAENVYKADSSYHLDFKTEVDQVISEVNLWAEKKTKGLIKNVLPPGSVDSLTRLIFANALYFKGAWTEKFDAVQTKDYDFYLEHGSYVKTPFMTSEKKQLISAYDGFKVLGLPYKRGLVDTRSFTMYIFLPDAKDGLKDLVEKASSESGFLERHLPEKPVAVGEFRIPRFKISSGFEACEVVKGLGVVLPFSYEADLTEMADNLPRDHNLYVSKLFHKCFVEVNEEGTEAAAVTAATIALCGGSFMVKTIDFVADHPFLFTIREDVTGVVLFTGLVLNPLEN
ncbi:hypothetical protein PTKIN_Ptkin13bG0036600 [Pterospermum kingtungense]